MSDMAKMLMVGLLGTLVAGEAAFAQSKAPSSPLVQAIAACRGQTDDAARLRCYDRAAGALADAAAKGSVVVVDREDVRKTRRSLFGFTLPKLPFFSGDNSQDDQEEQISAKIASAGAIGHGLFRMRLEDGAMWETTEASSVISPPKAGNQVLIKRGPLGSYMIRIAGQRGIRAKRVG
jgi:hypothetical protein